MLVSCPFYYSQNKRFDPSPRHKNIDGIYYITHMLIPPLERIFNLVGANVRQWFEDMPKPARTDTRRVTNAAAAGDGEDDSDDRQNIDEHFKSMQCVVCAQPSNTGEETGLPLDLF